MATKQQDEYLKTAFGVNPTQHRARAPAVAAAPGAPPSRPAPAVPPGAEEDPPPPVRGGAPPDSEATDAAPVKLPAGMVMIQPLELVKLEVALDSIAPAIEDGLAREQEIAAAGKTAHLDPSKTDAVAKASARLGAVITEEERERLHDGETKIRDGQQSIIEHWHRIGESRKHLVNFKGITFKEVHTEDAKAKAGKTVEHFYDLLGNAGKAVIDLVTGDLAKFGGWIVAQATLEIAGADIIKDGIERLVDGIEKDQKEIENGLNEVVGQLNAFDHKEIDALKETLRDLTSELGTRLKFLQDDAKEMGVRLGHVASAHKRDAGDFRPVMTVYQKIFAAYTALAKVVSTADQNATLADSKWPGLLLPLGTRDKTTLSLGENGEALVYRNGGGTHYFIIKTSGPTFAASADVGAAAIEKLADGYKTLQDARAACGRVKPIAEQWSKALSAGIDQPAKR
jgi:hypothetical protein